MEDFEYGVERNKLIPFAVRYADKKTGLKPKGEDVTGWSDKWNKLYHNRMNDLAKKKGLTN